jgi:hypothetical protein
VAPPATYVEKTDFGRRLQRLPPRLVLRPLASFRAVCYLALFFFLSSVVFGKSGLGSGFYLCVGIAVYVCANAFLLSPVDPGAADVSAGESFKKWD